MDKKIHDKNSAKKNPLKKLVHKNIRIKNYARKKTC